MTINSEMTREAEAYAAKLARMGSLKHSNSKDGENLAMSCGREMTASAATEMWYVYLIGIYTLYTLLVNKVLIYSILLLQREAKSMTTFNVFPKFYVRC